MDSKEQHIEDIRDYLQKHARRKLRSRESERLLVELDEKEDCTLIRSEVTAEEQYGHTDMDQSTPTPQLSTPTRQSSESVDSANTNSTPSTGDTLDMRSERKASHTEHTEAGIIIETPYEDTDSGVTGGDNLSISESVTEYTIEKTALCQNNNGDDNITSEHEVADVTVTSQHQEETAQDVNGEESGEDYSQSDFEADEDGQTDRENTPAGKLRPQKSVEDIINIDRRQHAVAALYSEPAEHEDQQSEAVNQTLETEQQEAKTDIQDRIETTEGRLEQTPESRLPTPPKSAKKQSLSARLLKSAQSRSTTPSDSPTVNTTAQLPQETSDDRTDVKKEQDCEMKASKLDDGHTQDGSIKAATKAKPMQNGLNHVKENTGEDYSGIKSATEPEEPTSETAEDGVDKTDTQPLNTIQESTGDGKSISSRTSSRNSVLKSNGSKGSLISNEDSMKLSDDKKQQSKKKTTTQLTQRKDGVKKTVKTAPVKLSNLITTKSATQQKKIISGVTKRLTNKGNNILNATKALKAGNKEPPNKEKVPANDTAAKVNSAKGVSVTTNSTNKESADKKTTQKKADTGVKSADKEKKDGGGHAGTEDQKLLIENELTQQKDEATPTGEEVSVNMSGHKKSLTVPSLPNTEEGWGDGDRSAAGSNESILLKINEANGKNLTDQVEKKKEPLILMSNHGSMLRAAIPYLPLPMAVVCLIFNIIIPGVGTILSGFFVLCRGRPRVESKDDQLSMTVCLNLMVGIAQLTTITFMFVGWFWSLSWGIYMVILAIEFKRLKQEELELKEKNYPALNPTTA